MEKDPIPISIAVAEERANINQAAQHHPPPLPTPPLTACAQVISTPHRCGSLPVQEASFLIYDFLTLKTQGLLSG